MRVALVGCGSIGRIHALAISEAKPAWLCGCADIRPERARAYAAEYGDGLAAGYDTLEAYLTFSSGEEPVRACFYSSNAYVADAPVLIELVCEQGFVRMEGSRVWYQTKELRQPVLWTESQTAMPGKAYWGNGHSACIKDFYDCLSENRPFQNDLASVENTFQTVMDIYDCASGLAADKR